jgi:hypothetical protein
LLIEALVAHETLLVLIAVADQDDAAAIETGTGHAVDRIGQPRAARREDHAQRARHLRTGCRHHGCGVFVPREHEFHPAGVRCGDDVEAAVAAGNAVEGPGSARAELGDERLGAGQA